MNFQDLRDKNVQRCESPTGFHHPLRAWSVAEWGNATAGEVGEACNFAKKMIRFRDKVPGNNLSFQECRKALAREIADALIYLDLWAASEGISLEGAVREAFNNKSAEIGCEIVL